MYVCMYVCMNLCMYVCIYVCMKKKPHKLTFDWCLLVLLNPYKLNILHKVTFDWCLSQLVVAVRLCPATTSSVVYGVYGGTEWGPQIRFCVSVTSRSRSKIRINVRKPIQNSNDDLKTPLDARWCRATNAKCITYLVRGLYRPILRRTQLETHEHKVKFKRKSIAAVNCTRRRPLTIAKCIAWHVRSGDQNMPNRERSVSATTKTN